MMAAVEFDNFSFAYRGKVQALEGITFIVAQGGFTVITGPCGAGKTTLCMAVSGLVPHYFGGSVGGRASIAGRSNLECRVSELALQVGTVLEDYESQLVTITVADEIAFGLENRGASRSEIKARSAEVLAMVGLQGKEHCEVGSLSGGQKQRLAIAAVLATKPAILVLDEPASALDPEGAEELYALLGELNRTEGLTIIVVEHDLSRVLPYADQIVLLNNGHMEKAGTVSEVLTHLHEQSDYHECLPALWEIKMNIENQTGIHFNGWKTENEATDELVDRLNQQRQGVPRSA
jgi:energy-coupling factor transport system ATP-binding protein